MEYLSCLMHIHEPLINWSLSSLSLSLTPSVSLSSVSPSASLLSPYLSLPLSPFCPPCLSIFLSHYIYIHVFHIKRNQFLTDKKTLKTTIKMYFKFVFCFIIKTKTKVSFIDMNLLVSYYTY